MPRDIPGSDILGLLQSEAQGAANVAATAIPGAISKVQSAASAAATAIPRAKAIEALIPRNCSLGTKQFCVGFSNRTECNSLPLNISDIVPKALANLVDDKAQPLEGILVSIIVNQVQALQPLEGILTRVTPSNTQVCLILGLVLMLVLRVIFACSIFSRIFSLASFLFKLGVFIRVIVCLVSGLICLIPFLIPTVILYILQSKPQNLPSSIEVEKGEVSGYCLGAFCCTVVMMLLITVT